MSDPTTIDPIQLLEDKVNSAREEDDANIFIASLIELGQAYLDTGDTPKALTQYEEGISFANKQAMNYQKRDSGATRGFV